MKIRPGILAIAATALALAVAAVAAAAPLVGPALRAAVSGSVFRGMANTFRGFENHIWRFAPDGRVAAVYNIRRNATTRGGGGFQYEGSATGTWSIQGDQLCIQWEPGYYTTSGCYRVVIDEKVSVLDGYYVRLIGGESWEGTLQR